MNTRPVYFIPRVIFAQPSSAVAGEMPPFPFLLLRAWPDKINKGGQFRPTDSNEKSLTADS